MGYALSPALPDGVVRDGFRLSWTSAGETAVTRHVWTATDIDGQVAELAFTIEVESVLARGRLAAINRSVPPELARAAWGAWWMRWRPAWNPRTRRAATW